MMKTRFFLMLVLLSALNSAAAGVPAPLNHLMLASLNEITLAQAVLNKATQREHLNKTLQTSMRLLSRDETKEIPLWDSKPIEVIPTKNVDQPGLGGERN